ncbi:hypothetical protein ACRQ5D_34095 [Mucilaginibacter sp. P25]|uniref:hypothetical protein n=1 Tax=Mucilaginibacter sp. P25 TaxID=3423945 RepID=UPI003D79899F
MKIDFKQPKYVLPAIVLPFLVLFFYAWQSGFSKKEPATKPSTDLNANVGDVSSYVRKKILRINSMLTEIPTRMPMGPPLST